MNDTKNNQYPLVAPCCRLKISAPWRWLLLGLADVRSAPMASLSYGLLMTAMLILMAALAWNYGGAWIMLSMLCGVVFAAPLACIGTYAISAQLERNQPVSIRRTFRACLLRYIGNELVFTLVLLVLFLVWARASSMVSVFMPVNPETPYSEMAGYVSSLSLVALLFLSITFAASVFALPMIMHRDVDAITAVVTSINAVLRNKLVMVIWALLIGLVLVIGFLSFGILLVVLLPAIGHAVWHGYLEAIDASEFPRHKTGITSVPRANKLNDQTKSRGR